MWEQSIAALWHLIRLVQRNVAKEQTTERAPKRRKVLLPRDHLLRNEMTRNETKHGS